MFYIGQRSYDPQLYPRFLGIMIPLILLVTIIITWRFHFEQWTIGISLLVMEIMTLESLDVDRIWFNPFHRSPIAPGHLDFMLTNFLQISLGLTIVYFIYNIVYFIRKKGASSC